MTGYVVLPARAARAINAPLPSPPSPPSPPSSAGSSARDNPQLSFRRLTLSSLKRLPKRITSLPSINTATHTASRPRSAPIGSKAAPDVTQRRSLLDHQVSSILEAAQASQVHASPISRADGRIDEVNVYGSGSLVGTVYRPASGTLAIWLGDRDQRHVANARAAIGSLLQARGLH